MEAELEERGVEMPQFNRLGGMLADQVCFIYANPAISATRTAAYFCYSCTAGTWRGQQRPPASHPPHHQLRGQVTQECGKVQYLSGSGDERRLVDCLRIAAAGLADVGLNDHSPSSPSSSPAPAPQVRQPNSKQYLMVLEAARAEKHTGVLSQAEIQVE